MILIPIIVLFLQTYGNLQLCQMLFISTGRYQQKRRHQLGGCVGDRNVLKHTQQILPEPEIRKSPLADDPGHLEKTGQSAGQGGGLLGDPDLGRNQEVRGG